jgi:uncharacterized protein YdhG (YjbR/CyaY superfamily)
MPVSTHEVDAYLRDVAQPQRNTLESLRETLRGLLPEAEEGLAYGVPCFKLDGAAVAGFAAYPKHCSYFPMSGSVLAAVSDHVVDYRTSKGALQFAVDTPPPDSLVRLLVSTRLAEIAVSVIARTPRG